MDFEIADRRLQRRFSGRALGLTGTMRPGCEVTVVDISGSGLKVETERPLRPGTRVHVRLEADGWIRQLWAVVLRCRVEALQPRVIYGGGLAFEQRAELPIAGGVGGPGLQSWSGTLLVEV
jgi:hypothetical protein